MLQDVIPSGFLMLVVAGAKGQLNIGSNEFIWCCCCRIGQAPLGRTSLTANPTRQGCQDVMIPCGFLQLAVAGTKGQLNIGSNEYQARMSQDVMPCAFLQLAVARAKGQLNVDS
jgi:hypothetical protein